VVARSARSSSDGRYLIFLGNKKGISAHNGCSELFKIDQKSIESLFSDETINELPRIDVLVPIVESAKHDKSNGVLSFPGIFAHQLPVNCFLGDNSSIIVNSLWGSVDKLLMISLVDGSVKPIDFSSFALPNGQKDFSCSLLDKSDENLLFTFSSPNYPPQIGVYNLISNSVIAQTTTKTSFSLLSKSITSTPSEKDNISKSPPNLDWDVFSHIKDLIPFQSIFLYPRVKEQEKESGWNGIFYHYYI
jgi:hypothetical protein